LQSAGAAGTGAADAVDDGAADVAGGVEDISGLAGLVGLAAGAVVVCVCVCGSLGPHAVSIRAAAAAAVDMAIPWKIF
jgi:hypothetical protein